MEWLYKIISRVEFYVLLVIIATGAFFFAIFKDLPNSANGYSPTARENLLLPLFFVGATAFLSGVVAFFARDRVKSRATPSGDESELKQTGKTLTASTILAGQVKATPTNPHDDKQWEEDLVSTYGDLPKTQRRVVTLICEMPVAQMPIDDFSQSFDGRFGPAWVQGVSEMYYRIDSLSLRGLCELKKIGPGASVVIRIQRVSKSLRERDLLVS
jgi:hypothetical protein